MIERCVNMKKKEKNEVYILKKIIKSLKQIKENDEKIYAKIAKGVETLRTTEINRLIKAKRLSEIEGGDVRRYLFSIDDVRSLVVMIKDNGIYVIDLLEVVEQRVKSILIDE